MHDSHEAPVKAICRALSRSIWPLVWCAVGLVLLSSPAPARAAGAWWNGDWQYRKPIMVKLPGQAGAASAATVVPIRLHSGNFAYFQDLQPGGTDLRFIAPDGSALRYQVELLDAAAGLLVAWVQIPAAPTSNQPIWMYYGNPRATKPDDAGLYDANQSLVLHFGESQGVPRDATANHYDASPTTVQLGVPGVIGNGARFDGHGVIRIAARPGLALAPTGGLTFAAWVRPDSVTQRALLYSHGAADARVEVGISNGKLYLEIRDYGTVNRLESASDLSPGHWQHVAATVGADLALYIDGAPSGSRASGGVPAIAGDVLIGGPDTLNTPNAEGGFVGQMDEVQLSRTARPAAWVWMSAAAQNPEATLLAYGTDESRGTSGKFVAYLAMMRNLLSQVSLDGLVVITITGLMGIASMQVLISKAGLLKRIERQDGAFLQHFSDRFAEELGVSAKGGAVSGDAAYKDSGLQQMYLAGLKGVQEANAAAGGAARDTLLLGSEGFEAVRAALDSALVEATNRMNHRLVTVTVAIAGAPFLGLLGTVVGVMITFASIAAAGDVNVNTIAPGVAAAMTATVAGLLVAIPSLFGYNWLATRIGRRTAAMEVFADQFLSRLALLTVAAREQPPGSVRDGRGRPSYAA